MSNTHTFMIAAADADDTQLTALIRSSYLAQRDRERSNWLKQIELGLDGYGDRHRDTAARIRNILRFLPLEPRNTTNDAPQAASGHAGGL